MSPQIEKLQIPPKLVLVRRRAEPEADERPMLRTEDGHVLAVIETWRPELAN